jgi:hypothetical protein
VVFFLTVVPESGNLEVSEAGWHVSDGRHDDTHLRVTNAVTLVLASGVDQFFDFHGRDGHLISL